MTQVRVIFVMHLFALRTLNPKSTQQRLPIKIPKLVTLRGELVTWGVGAPGKARAGEGKSRTQPHRKHPRRGLMSPWLTLLGSHY